MLLLLSLLSSTSSPFPVLFPLQGVLASPFATPFVALPHALPSPSLSTKDILYIYALSPHT